MGPRHWSTLTRSVILGAALALLWQMRLVFLAAVLSSAASCPPQPQPTPTPPQPTPSPTQPPTGNAIQYTTAGGVWGPSTPFGYIGCCNTPASDGARGWTFVDEHEVTAYASGKAKLGVWRTGPYSDQGNGWGMITPIPGVRESRLRSTCKKANEAGIACLVEAGTDYWSMKQQNVAFQMYSDTCALTQGAPPERYQRWTRQVVHEVGDLKVLWSLGNEGWLCSPSRAWYDGLVAQIKQAEIDFGFPPHPIGNVYKAGEVPFNANGSQGPLYDFVEVHGPPEAFCNMANLSIPIIWTESENENPPESPQRMLQAKACADTSGGKKAALLWRGGIQDPQWQEIFAANGGNAPKDIGRHDTSCLWNQWDHYYQGSQGNAPDPTTTQRMIDTVEKVIAYIGPESWLFTNGGNNLRSKGDASDDYQRIDYFSLLDAMQDGCTIVGNPEAESGNPLWEVDNIESFLNTDPCMQSGSTLAWHAIIFGNPGNFNQVQRGDQLKQFSAVFKGRQDWVVNSPPCTSGPTPTPPPGGQSCGAMGGVACSSNGTCPTGMVSLGNSVEPPPNPSCTPCCGFSPAPSPSPTTPPTTPPSASPSPSACAAVPTDVTSWRNIAKSNQTNQQIDITPVACGPNIVATNQNCGTQCCELSAEKGNIACADKLYGQPSWVPQGVTLVQVFPDNTYTMKVASPPSPDGRITVCGSKNADRRSCVQFPARGGVPACDMIAGSSQGCAQNVQ